MPNLLNASGLETATYTELIDQYTTALQTIYGSDITLTSDSPDGQLINLFIQSVLDVQDLLMQIYNSFDPDNAIGNVLDQRVAINGIQRQAGTFSVTNVTITTNQSVNLYGLDQSANPVYTVSDSAGNQWQLVTTQLGLSIGANVLVFQSATPGANLTIPNTITVPVSIVLGVVSINNPTAATSVGINEETDAALKIRRQISVSLSSQGYLAGLLAALENINGITSAFVFENDTPGTDGDGIPGHSIWAIVAGVAAPAVAPVWSATTSYSYGQIASSAGVNYISWQNSNLNNVVSNTAFWGVYNPVAQAIYSKRNAGCGMFGATSYVVTQIDGTSFIVYWDVVTSETLYIKFTVSSLDLVHAPNISLIRSQLPAVYIPAVNAEVNINQLSTLVQQLDGNTLVTTPGFSTSSGGSYTNTLRPSAKSKQFAISSNNIIILPMILSAPTGTAVINGSGTVTTTNVTVAHGGNTIQFTGLGGFGTLTYSMQSGAGSVNSSTGLYTSSTAGTDVVLVTDGLSNTATATVTVT